MLARSRLARRLAGPDRRATLAATGLGLLVLAFAIPSCCHGYSIHREMRRVAEAYDGSADKWRSVPSVPLRVAGARAVTVNGGIYLVGGETRGGFAGEGRTLFRYDPVARRWERLEDIPTPRSGNAVAAVGPDIYVLGGFPNRTAVEVYDTSTAAWRAEPDMPTERFDFGAVSIGSFVYAMGGGTDLFDVLDTTTGIWSPLTPMPEGLSSFASATDGSRIFVMGGAMGGRTERIFSDSVWIYDVGTDGWSSGPDMPVPGNYLAATIDGARVYLFGTFGNNPRGPFHTAERRRHLVLSTPTLTWADGKRKRNTAYGVAPAAEGGWIYVFGGWGNWEKRGCGA